MKKYRVLCLSTALLAGVAANASAQKNKATCGPDVTLAVTISGSQTAPQTYSLVSDGVNAGIYSHATKGSSKVTAIFQVQNCSHDFTLNLNFSQRSMFALLEDADSNPFVRRGNFFNFDRIHSVPITEDTSTFLASVFCTDPNGVVRNTDGTIRKNDDGSYQDNYGGCHVDEQGRGYVRRAGGTTLEADERLSYNVSPIDQPSICPDPNNQVCGASFVRVYHPDASTWYIRSEPSAQASYRRLSGSSFVPLGYQTITFEIQASRQ